MKNPPGPSIYELVWERMDELTDIVMSGTGNEKTTGMAMGVAEALAIFTNPYHPDPKAIRDEAKKRWRERE